MTYSEDQLTGWFDVEKQKPWEKGVYLVETANLHNGYSYWDGKTFNWVGSEIEYAIGSFVRGDRGGSGIGTVKWRGLSQNPNAKPKRSGNKRKVMYVVAHKATRCVEAVFSKKKNAQEYAEHLNFSVYITKIRFRTPEHN